MIDTRTTKMILILLLLGLVQNVWTTETLSSQLQQDNDPHEQYHPRLQRSSGADECSRIPSTLRIDGATLIGFRKPQTKNTMSPEGDEAAFTCKAGHDLMIGGAVQKDRYFVKRCGKSGTWHLEDNGVICKLNGHGQATEKKSSGVNTGLLVAVVLLSFLAVLLLGALVAVTVWTVRSNACGDEDSDSEETDKKKRKKGKPTSKGKTPTKGKKGKSESEEYVSPLKRATQVMEQQQKEKGKEKKKEEDYEQSAAITLMADAYDTDGDE